MKILKYLFRFFCNFYNFLLVLYGIRHVSWFNILLITLNYREFDWNFRDRLILVASIFKKKKKNQVNSNA